MSRINFRVLKAHTQSSYEMTAKDRRISQTLAQYVYSYFIENKTKLNTVNKSGENWVEQNFTCFNISSTWYFSEPLIS